jgi:hypothetical protein
MKIKHFRNKEIDFNRWDNAIAQSDNQLVYAFSWYLDIVSPEWEALIGDDYSYVMPLTVKTRYKIPYLVQPLLTQQLGVFSRHKITDNIVEKFIKEIPYFSYEVNLNEKNFYSKSEIHPNFLLNLSQSYENIYANFSKNTQRNIEKAIKFNLKIQDNLTPEDYLSFYFSVDKHYLSPQQPFLRKLIEKGISENALNIYGVISAENELIASLCLLKSRNRLTYLLPVSNSKGKTLFAMFHLINYLIKEYVETNYVLDFEGSKVEGIARLYRGFGAELHPYFILKRFRPTFLIRKQ